MIHGCFVKHPTSFWQILPLLRRFHSEQSIDFLITNIDAPQEKNSISTAAMDALVQIGEPAIPKLLNALEGFNDVRKQFCAVQTIARIQGKNYDAFLRENETSFSPKTRHAFETMSWQY